MREKNKRILVTGAAKRIGRILSLLIAREGGEVIIHHNNSIGIKFPDLVIRTIMTTNTNLFF
jgi:NAD(P)-dependent dehydrogenase (short-subunit alcohol dehydrogenase family)